MTSRSRSTTSPTAAPATRATASTSASSRTSAHFGCWCDEVTAGACGGALRAIGKPTRVARYLLPNIGAMNFVLDDVLDGGVNDSLNLDMHGKSLSFHLLTCRSDVPATSPRAPAITEETT